MILTLILTEILTIGYAPHQIAVGAYRTNGGVGDMAGAVRIFEL